MIPLVAPRGGTFDPPEASFVGIPGEIQRIVVPVGRAYGVGNAADGEQVVKLHAVVEPDITAARRVVGWSIAVGHELVVSSSMNDPIPFHRIQNPARDFSCARSCEVMFGRDDAAKVDDAVVRADVFLPAPFPGLDVHPVVCPAVVMLDAKIVGIVRIVPAVVEQLLDPVIDLLLRTVIAEVPDNVSTELEPDPCIGCARFPRCAVHDEQRLGVDFVPEEVERAPFQQIQKVVIAQPR